MCVCTLYWFSEFHSTTYNLRQTWTANWNIGCTTYNQAGELLSDQQLPDIDFKSEILSSNLWFDRYGPVLLITNLL